VLAAHLGTQRSSRSGTAETEWFSLSPKAATVLRPLRPRSRCGGQGFECKLNQEPLAYEVGFVGMGRRADPIFVASAANHRGHRIQTGARVRVSCGIRLSSWLLSSYPNLP
jgi:hypothetical protein